jgi:chromosomal replication initiator protein
MPIRPPSLPRSPMSHTAPIDASRISSGLARRLGNRKVQMWFGQGTRFSVRDGDLEVVATSGFAADWIGRNFADALRDVARESLGLGDAARVEVRAPSNPPEEPVGASRVAVPAASEPSVSRLRAPETSSGLHPFEPTAGGVGLDAPPSTARTANRPHPSDSWRRLGDFVVGDGNRLAFDAARRIAEADDAADRILFLHGECGVGKTHLLQAICRQRRERIRAAKIRYTTGEAFTNEFIASVRSGSLEAFRRRFRGLELLAIDDVHFLSNKTATQSEFLHTLDSIALGGSRVVLASDDHPRQIGRFHRSLVSRFLAGMVVRIEPPDRETRRTLLRRLASQRGLRLGDAAEECLVGRFVGSARELEGAVAKLAALASLGDASGDSRGEIGMLLVEQLLEEDRRVARRTPIRLASIVEAVSEHFEVDREEILGGSKLRRASEARGVVAHLARRLTTLSFPEIARGLGRRNHSAIHAAEARTREAIDSPGDEAERLRESIDRLSHALLRGQ